jgi:hypothetical protein
MIHRARSRLRIGTRWPAIPHRRTSWPIGATRRLAMIPRSPLCHPFEM